MKRNKLFKMLTSAALTGALVMSMGGMTAFAETQDVTITKKITKKEKVYTPAVGTINFAVNPVEVTEGSNTDANGKLVYSGLNGGVIFSSGATFSVNEGDLNETAVTADATLKINKSVFYDSDNHLKPGIYRYSVVETDPNYDGLTADTKTYYLDVYVSNENGKDTFSTYLFDSADGNKGKVGSIENSYVTNVLTVSKTVTGNQGDKNKPFNFTITVEGVAGETYQVVKGDGTVASAVCERNNIATITVPLTDGQSVKIIGLSVNDKFTVVEAEANQDGYNTSYKLDDGEASADVLNTGIAEGITDKVVEVINDRTITTPTGIALTFAPYILMVALAGVFAVLFLRRRREEF